jgi:hypothetical protein
MCRDSLSTVGTVKPDDKLGIRELDARADFAENGMSVYDAAKVDVRRISPRLCSAVQAPCK